MYLRCDKWTLLGLRKSLVAIDRPLLADSVESKLTYSIDFRFRMLATSRITRSNGQGFTLLEMLVVLVIIAMLAGLVGPRLFSKVDQSKVQTAQVQVKMLRGAVETLRLDIGRLPTEAEGLSVLAKAPGDASTAARWRGPYLDDALPTDPWGAPYQYATQGADGQPFALYSLGSDGKRGGEGDAKDIGFLPAGN